MQCRVTIIIVASITSSTPSSHSTQRTEHTKVFSISQTAQYATHHYLLPPHDCRNLGQCISSPNQGTSETQSIPQVQLVRCFSSPSLVYCLQASSKDNNGGNNPSFHSSPVRGACTKIDGSMVSAYVVPGSGAKAVFYMDDNCTQKLREQTAGEECVVLFQIAKGKNIAAVAMV